MNEFTWFGLELIILIVKYSPGPTYGFIGTRKINENCIAIIVHENSIIISSFFFIAINIIIKMIAATLQFTCFEK